ncbi:MAG: ABC transporter substrate-binding protein [Thermoprotei archaeon]
MRTSPRRKGVSATVGVIIAVIVVVIIVGAVAAVVLTSRKSTTLPTTTTSSKTTSSTTTSTSSKLQPLAPPNSSVLVDDSQTAAPDGLDPAFGFYTQDEPVFDNVYQQLVEMNGTQIIQVVPVLASGYTIENNFMNYTFNIRPHVRFSDGNTVTAADFWFSFVRELYMGQTVGFANYLGLTQNSTYFFDTSYAIPWGLQRAVAYATGNPVAAKNTTVMVAYLNNILSHWNPNNATIEKLMSYPDQAYVVTGPMTFQINLLVHYRYFLDDLTGWWGAVVDPAYVDAHGGVQANTANSYFNANGGPGTGPYMIKTVGASLSTVTLVKNPYYWANNVSGLPQFLEPAHIPVVIINFALSHTDRVESFATNRAQISYVSIPFFSQMYETYNYRNQYSFNQIFYNAGPSSGFQDLQFNTQVFPTNNRDFRFALVHAINYTELLYKLYGFNGTAYATEFYGPVDPFFPQYNEVNHTNYQYNLNIAAKYLNMSMWQMGYQLVMPNGTVLGNPKSPLFPAQVFQTIAPITPSTQLEIEIIDSGFKALGIPISVQPVTATVASEELTPNSTPPIGLGAWGPDWADPYNQLVLAAYTTFDGLGAWMNVSSINKILYNISYETNPAEQISQLRYVYNFTYYYAPYAWLPDPNVYVFVQPYVKGIVYNYINAVVDAYYNTMYYSPT